jgi:hypothetical protein
LRHPKATASKCDETFHEAVLQEVPVGEAMRAIKGTEDL